MDFAVDRIFPSIVSIVLFLLSFAGVVVNFIILQKIANNDLKHLELYTKDVNNKLDKIAEKQEMLHVAVIDRVAKLEGIVIGLETGKRDKT